MCGGFVAELGGDGFYEGVGLAEFDGGLGELEAGEAGQRGFGVVALEEAGEVGGGDVAGFGRLLNAVERWVIAQEVTTTAQVGGVGGVDFGGGGLAGVCAEDQGVLKRGAGCEEAEAAAAQGVIDYFLQKGDDAGGVCHAEDAAGGEIKIAHQLCGAGTGEIEEVLHHGLLGGAADDLGGGGVEDEGVAGFDFVGLSCERDAAMAFGHELEGQEGELLPVHDEIRGAPLAAAAYEAEGGGIALAILPIREEEAAGADDLGRKIVSLVGGGHGGGTGSKFPTG